MRTLVILPTYDEAHNVLRAVKGLLAAAPNVEIVVVDDASPDGTGDLVAEAAKHEPRLHLLRREGKLGLGTAYLAGFRYGLDEGFDRFVTMDADLSHDPAALPSILRAMDDHDMVIGSRYARGGGTEGWELHRRALSAFANLYTRTLLRLPVGDCTSGYRCYSRKVLENAGAFDIRASGYSFLYEMVWRVHRCGFRIGEVPIVYSVRTHGTSKIDRSEIHRAARHVITTAFRRPPRTSEPGDR